jgi:hypothetical protein
MFTVLAGNISPFRLHLMLVRSENLQIFTAIMMSCSMFEMMAKWHTIMLPALELITVTSCPFGI